MNDWYNTSGKQLSSIDWLILHHKAKFEERKAFIKKHIKDSDKKILDLGCGPALWLELIDSVANNDCEFIGVDIDINTLKYAQNKASTWNRKTTFINCDIEKDIENLEKVDVILVFNMFSYIKKPEVFLMKLYNLLNPGGRIIIRQYDGGTLRIGPMAEELRRTIDNSLLASLSSSKEFHHYDMDRVYKIVQDSPIPNKEFYLELYQKVSPYTITVEKYIEENMNWIKNYVSDYAKEKISDWLDTQFKNYSYFIEVDLVVILS